MDDDMTPVKQLLAKHPVDYRVGLGDEKLGERYGKILGLPQSFLIDQYRLLLPDTRVKWIFHKWRP